ncbi:hypothetical protein ZOD2009_20088 [Haladaptatus paucihalophilus DX253]|uniref:Uncharacterized protein n=1 Tax=Haladaptatus paucihalophilus DX253 TaxID=797209 RepID=E7QYX7_HALPU|nr:hypothetical protein ZOD2009_20088 [Haladaptatus paucihalophilus DX253]
MTTATRSVIDLTMIGHSLSLGRLAKLFAEFCILVNEVRDDATFIETLNRYPCLLAHLTPLFFGAVEVIDECLTYSCDSWFTDKGFRNFFDDILSANHIAHDTRAGSTHWFKRCDRERLRPSRMSRHLSVGEKFGQISHPTMEYDSCMLFPSFRMTLARDM